MERQNEGIVTAGMLDLWRIHTSKNSGGPGKSIVRICD